MVDLKKWIKENKEVTNEKTSIFRYPNTKALKKKNLLKIKNK